MPIGYLYLWSSLHTGHKILITCLSESKPAEKRIEAKPAIRAFTGNIAIEYSSVFFEKQ